MTSFFQRILNPGGRAAAESGPARLALAVFGKHPGWNDHIPGIGVETESLAHAKHAMYVSGIGGRIDAGAWKNLEAEKRIEGFDHIFLWLRGGHMILGRMHSSEDGLRRKEYPFVVCVDAEGISPATMLTAALPELELLTKACQATTSTGTVTEECRRTQDRLRALLTGDGARASTPPPGLEARRRFLDHHELGPDRVGLLRILHELGSVGGKAAAQSRHLRIPLADNSRITALGLWTEFLRLVVPPALPLFIVSRNGAEWLDVIVGEPVSDDFFCLQALPTALPLASQVPYDLSPTHRERLQELEAKFTGTKVSVSPPPPPVPPASKPSPVNVDVQSAAPIRKKTSWFLILLGFVVLGSVAAVWLFSGNRGSPKDDKPMAVATNPAPVKIESVTSNEPVSPVTVETKIDEAAQRKVVTEAKRLEAEQKLAAEKAGEQARLKEEKLRADEAERKRLEEVKQVANPTVNPVDEKQRAEDAGLAQLAVATGDYTRATEICLKWPGTSPFKELLTRVNSETNLLHQVGEFLKVGNYPAVLTNQLPENEKFAPLRTTAESEKKILADAAGEFAVGNYTFLQRETVQNLKAKPPFQKLIQSGQLEAGQLQQAQTFKDGNQPEQAMNLLVQNKLEKPPFAGIRQWAAAELNRLAGIRREQQEAERLFKEGEYSRAMNLCKQHTGLPAFDALAGQIDEEQKVLAAGEKRFAAGDYGFVGEWAAKDYRAKPQFATLLRKGEAEQKLLTELNRLKQTDNWREVRNQLTTNTLVAAGGSKKPFVELRAWAQAKYEADEKLKGQDPGWLDAELEVLLVWFNVLPPNDPWLKTAKARQERRMDGGLNQPQVNSYLAKVRWLRQQYELRSWLNPDRKKYLDKLEANINERRL